MSRVDEYRASLKQRSDWDQYLLEESRLPGPRANLELAQAVPLEGNLELFLRYLQYSAQEAPYGSHLEFLPVCGVLGLGEILSEDHTEFFEQLRRAASDPRWRIREAAAMALQNYGDRNPDRLLQEMKAWSQGTWLEKRAAAAALCEPRLLRRMEDPGPVFDLLDQMTQSLYESRDRTSEDLKVLRQGLGYCWSVAAVSAPDAGKSRMEHWLVQTDPDIRWIMKENLKKNRLKKMDPVWTEHWLAVLSNKAV